MSGTEGVSRADWPVQKMRAGDAFPFLCVPVVASINRAHNSFGVFLALKCVLQKGVFILFPSVCVFIFRQPHI